MTQAFYFHPETKLLKSIKAGGHTLIIPIRTENPVGHGDQFRFTPPQWVLVDKYSREAQAWLKENNFDEHGVWKVPGATKQKFEKIELEIFDVGEQFMVYATSRREAHLVAAKVLAVNEGL